MRRAFTLIEMTVVISVLTLMALLITPNLVAMARARDQRVLEDALARLPAEARQEARRAKAPVQLRVEGDAVVAERTPVGEDPQEFKRLTLGGELSVQGVRQGGEDQALDSWTWTVYPDGSARAATLTVQAGAVEKSLALTVEGDAHWGGDPNDDPEESWDAGEAVLRG